MYKRTSGHTSCIMRSLNGPDSSYSPQSEGTRPHTDTGRSTLACDALAGRGLSAAASPAGVSSATAGFAVSDGGVDLSSAPRAPAAMGLAPEWLKLSSSGLTPRVIFTTQSTRASSPPPLGLDMGYKLESVRRVVFLHTSLSSARWG